MKLPFTDQLKIDSAKLSAYLLNTQHPDGGTKAKFFKSIGIDEMELKSILLEQVAQVEVASTKESTYGTKYILESKIFLENGKTFILRSIWIVFLNQKTDNFVTAYPI